MQNAFLLFLLAFLMAPALARADSPAAAAASAQSQSENVEAGKTARAEKTFHAAHFTLENGMRVVVIPNHRAPVVTHMVWYRVGAADELPGLSGMAHYFEHLMFKGTKQTGPGEFSKTVKKLGGNGNAFTGQDYTAYFQSISTAHLEKVMKMEADRMRNLAPPEAHFASEKQVVLEERRQRTDNDPRAVFGEQMRSLLYVNHPYATPVIGWMVEIERYSWVDVKDFYDRWYAPNNAILIVSGDITAQALRPLAEKTYGTVPARELPPRKRPDIPPGPAPVYLEMRHAAIQQPVLYKAWLAPGFAQNKADSLALQVLEDILSGGPTTRLYRSLVVDQKKAVSVSFSYNAESLDYSGIWVTAVPAQGTTLAELEDLVTVELNKVISQGISEQELRDAVQRLQDRAVFARDSLTGPAMIMGVALTTGATIEDVEFWPQEIAKLSPEQVQAAARKYLQAETPWLRAPVTGYLLPASDEGKESAL